MDIRIQARRQKKGIRRFAQAGFIAKGIVYILLGLVGFMAAFDIAGQSTKDATSSGVFSIVQDFPGGSTMLFILAAGLACYVVWRFIQAFGFSNEDVKWAKRIRYAASGLAYLSIAYTAVRMALYHARSKGDQNQDFAAEILNKPFGQWLLGIVALIFAGNGIYQLYYAMSEKYKDHVQKMNLAANASHMLLLSGKIGYIARGIVWLLIAYLLMQAAIYAASSQAGNTGKAFQFFEDNLGYYFLGALGLGLVAYGIFNFVRARYERFM